MVDADPRTSRGVRMSRSLWAYVDAVAAITDEGSSSALIERWVREKCQREKQDSTKDAA